MSSADSRAQRRWNPLWFWGAAAAVATWLLTLALLALFTANPVTINRAQIFASDAVVVARVTSVSDDGVATVEIERVLAGDRVPQTIQLTRTAEVLEAGRGYLLPLHHGALGLEITPAPARAEETYLAYPASDEVVRNVKELLKSGAPRPYP